MMVKNWAHLSRGFKRAIMIAYDGCAMLLGLWLAFCTRLGELYWPESPAVFLLMAAAIVLGLAAITLIGVYHVVVRYLDIRGASRLAAGAGAAAAIWFIVAYVSKMEELPRSVGFIYFGILYLLMFFGRLAASQLMNGDGQVTHSSVTRQSNKGRIGVVIQGANPTGLALAESLRRDPQYQLRFFVDENPALFGRMILGFKIRSSAYLKREVDAGTVEQVFLALPSATRQERMAALSQLSAMSVRVMTVPSHEEIVSGRFTISDVRPIRVEDLLKRNIVPPLQHLIQTGISGRSILVTGAGGSIGSELSRQILANGPRRLVLLDHSESALYSIETELQTQASASGGRGIEIIPVVGSTLREGLVTDVLGRYDVDTVFHTAAYKHVPLLEDNEVVGVENNVMGTKVLADACIAAGVARLTMVSTDKAVRPTNVMGRSKRVAELYIQALAQERDVKTCFGIVRFGNVLDSSGSVVQQFRSQIRKGGPVTVTDPDITRFFMSIPEATQLIMQANSLATAGEVFVLDMGEPVRIVDLARTMITLSGMTERTTDNPRGDIAISYVGLRPGEKLHEELFIGERIADTEHPQIKMARERSVPLSELQGKLGLLREALLEHDRASVRNLLQGLLVLDYRAAA